MHLGGRSDFLHPVIWSHLSSLIRFRDGSHSECALNLVQISEKNATETLAMIRQAFGEENMSHTWVFEWHALFSADQKRRDR
jgi:hypothetical protein